MIHQLKTWPEYFNKIVSGYKKFELRKNDRDFDVGDTLVLQEWDPSKDSYTGEIYTVVVSYILRGDSFGIDNEYCIMSIIPFVELNK